jgi:hypothetical protein
MDAEKAGHDPEQFSFELFRKNNYAVLFIALCRQSTVLRDTDIWKSNASYCTACLYGTRCR